MARDEEGVVRRHVLLRWGLPRDPRGSEHVLGFVLTTVATIVVTRAYLQLTGFPQVGGETLHIAHVLWGGLFMALAMVLVLSFAGPVVRPPAAFLGGIGFGLFIDEVGKFLTQDNDYFFQPAPMIMYLTLVVLIILADVLHGRRPPHPSEQLAAAADHGVAGLAGGLSPRRRAVAEELLRKGRGGEGAAEGLLLAVGDLADEVRGFNALDAASLLRGPYALELPVSGVESTRDEGMAISLELYDIAKNIGETDVPVIAHSGDRVEFNLPFARQNGHYVANDLIRSFAGTE